MFFELREYRVKDDRRDEWAHYMDEVIIPYQVSKGMIVVGSFYGQEEEDLYIWIRRFENESERERLYQAVYQNDYWRDEVDPKVAEMLDRTRTSITRIEATPKSIIR